MYVGRSGVGEGVSGQQLIVDSGQMWECDSVRPQYC